MMEPKRSKYDTNPLDPEVARKTEQVWGDAEDVPSTGGVKGATTRVGPQPNNAVDSARSNVYSEAPTRTFNSPPSGDSSYPSVFVPPTYAPPAEVYKPPQGPYQQPLVRTVPYAPAYIGVVASIIELLLVPRREVRVRGHAAQGLALQLAIVAITMLFSIVGAITGSSAGGKIFWLAQFTFLIISMIRVGKGATHRIAPLTEAAEWLNKHIDPRR
jgi:uncharacterized membrane protein